MPSDWVCDECEQENTGDDAECVACENPRPTASPYAGYKVARVVGVEAIPKTKLRAVKVQVDDATELTIVTNARVDAGEERHIVVATIGSTVTIDGEEVEVKKATVGGRKSEGMLVDAPMLGWKGGAAGAAVFLPNTFAIGSEPPASRP
ncbi:hypothetical protein SPRG_10600 [Saprolegnia parasitica CBS 223.65]|uniref:RanBP2-type domain-containing protein n=1 Tax=Saprolegnia parasitica (strain CBS 223.65) TaxID=695850 RepID=A0A067CBM6_SAPPC|nr:hypothetical protein SPRG_10600 [Saprolegnia parasitica CBS 223.65]KDO24172.1 hypothetical protein SPRG_10600 [Saprolegnia parasitica CBS 223.65]|eukprot:XP_012205116.1 hypothetical protein SPRG_10600 [Saprolegnia parasitica CBS 223.65]